MIEGSDSTEFNNLLNLIEDLDPASAIGHLKQAIQANPNDIRPLLILAAELIRAGQTDAAEATYISILQHAPNLHIARFQLGLLQLTLARPAAASATWSLLDTLDPENPLRLFKSGLEYMALDQFDEAVQCINRGIGLNEDNLPLNGDMEQVLMQIEQLQHKTGSTDQLQGTPTADQAKKEDENHFLVSNYRNLH